MLFTAARLGGRAKNCFPAPNELLDLDLPANSIAVYIYPLRHANRKTNQCYPSEATIAKRLHLSRNTVAKHIRLLEDRGLNVMENTEVITNGNSANWSCQQNADKCKRNSLGKPARERPGFTPVRRCIRFLARRRQTTPASWNPRQI